MLSRTPVFRSLVATAALFAAHASDAEDQPCRVVVVGAGTAGLASAQTLKRLGCETVVLEARSELGGRTHTVTEGPFAGVELGAHWVHGGLDNIVSAPLLKYLGIDIVPVGGNDDFEGQRKRMVLLDEEKVLTGAERNASFLLFQRTADLMRGYLNRTVDPTCDGSPKCRQEDVNLKVAWNAALAALRPAPTPKELRLLNLLMRLKFEQDAGNVLAKLGGRVQMMDDYVDYYPAGGRGDAYVVGGYTGMVEALAKGLDIHLETPVTSVEETAAGVRVSTPRGEFNGTHVILTPHPRILQHISMQPPLPPWKQESLGRIGAGPVAKVLVLLKDELPVHLPDNQNFYSFATTGNESNFISFCVYTSAEHPKEPRLSKVLECFMGADALQTFETLPEVVRNRRLTAELRATFGRPSIKVVHMKLSPWKQEKYIGCAWSYPPVGTVTGDFTNISRSTGRLHFAGEGYCRLLFGNVHAALASAARAVHELLPEHLRARVKDSDWPLLRPEVRTACDIDPRRYSQSRLEDVLRQGRPQDSMTPVLV